MMKRTPAFSRPADLVGEDRPMTLRGLATRVASHQRIVSAVIAAMQAELPHVIEELLGEMANDSGGTLRLYRRKRPAAVRRARDDQIRALLAQGVPLPSISAEVRCSIRHIYSVRRTWLAAQPAQAVLPEAAEVCKTSP